MPWVTHGDQWQRTLHRSHSEFSERHHLRGTAEAVFPISMEMTR